MSAAADWVVAAATDAPAPLVRRVVDVLHAAPDAGASPAEVAAALLHGAEALLAQVLADRPRASAREVALDLLAADACVTWALEADPIGAAGRAAAILERLAAVAA